MTGTYASGADRQTVFLEVSDGVRTVYPISFDLGYLSKDYVYVYQGEHADYNNQLVYTWVDDDNIELAQALPDGAEFWIRRIVPRDDLINYFTGASLNPSAIDNTHLQLLMISQEIMDGFGDPDGLGNIKNILDMRGYRITNLGNAIERVDAVAYGQVLDLTDPIYDQLNALNAAVAAASQSAGKSEESAQSSYDSAIISEQKAAEAHQWEELAKSNANQTFVSGGIFDPSGTTEYPDVATIERDTIWITVIPEGTPTYTYTTGVLAGKNTSSGDMILYNTPEYTFTLIPSSFRVPEYLWESETYTNVSGQTVFNVPSGYEAVYGLTKVYYNGVYLSTTAFNITDSGTTVTLTEPVDSVDDVVTVEVWNKVGVTSMTVIEDSVSDAETAATAAQATINYQGEWEGNGVAGESYLYNGEIWLCLVSTVNTPSAGNANWRLTSVAAAISTKTSESAQDFIDSFALKIFQSPTDGGLTEIQTRTTVGSEVYEVRKVSDDSFATIYSDATGTTEIVQNGTGNVSGSDGVVEFYIDDGDYYIGADGTINNFSVSDKRVTQFYNGDILPYLDSDSKTGIYKLNGVTDTPRSVGMLEVKIATSGEVYGSAEFTSYGREPIKAVNIVSEGIWSGWKEILTEDNANINYLERTGNFYNRGGVPVERSSTYEIGKGSYSWWCEPNVNQLSEFIPLLAVGCVGAHSRRVFINKPTSLLRDTLMAHMAENTVGNVGDVGDEHNSPVTVVIDGNIHMFFTGHAANGKIWGCKGTGLDPFSLSRPEVIYDDPDGATSYVQFIEAANGVYIFYRSTPTKWKFLFSGDRGVSWEPRNLINSEGTEQLYMRATASKADGSVIDVVALYHPNFYPQNRLWSLKINTLTGNLLGEDNTILSNVNSAGNPSVTVTSMIEMYASQNGRIRLFDVQHSATNYVKMLICDYSSRNHVGVYRYIEYNKITGENSREADICDAGVFIGDGYHSGCSFRDLSFGQGNPSPWPVYVARRENSVSTLERYSSADGGHNWYLVETMRTSSNGDKIWRPRPPYNSSRKKSFQEVEVVWNEGTFDGYEDYDSTIYAKLNVANPI